MQKDKDEKSPLLKLLNERKAWELPEYVRPQFTAEATAKNRYAARAWATVDKSDPFSERRAFLALKQGYIMRSDLEHDTKSLLKHI